MTTLYQLWCYYETADEWKMEGFYDSQREADEAVAELREQVETPCMTDWAVVEVKGEW